MPFVCEICDVRVPDYPIYWSLSPCITSPHTPYFDEALDAVCRWMPEYLDGFDAYTYLFDCWERYGCCGECFSYFDGTPTLPDSDVPCDNACGILDHGRDDTENTQT